jgi:hypothetical protein
MGVARVVYLASMAVPPDVVIQRLSSSNWSTSAGPQVQSIKLCAMCRFFQAQRRQVRRISRGAASIVAA